MKLSTTDISAIAMVKSALGLLGLGAIAYATFCLALWLGQTRLIFYPPPAPASTPADIGLPYEEVWIPVSPGQIHGWWLPSRRPNANTVLVLHGNASNVENTLQQTLPFLEIGLSALIIDYRGYGLSSGPFPNEARVYEDATAAWNYLTQIRKIPAESIIIFGHSIGGAIAIELAQHEPAAAGLIVQASFTSMGDMVERVGYSRLAPKSLLHQRFDSLSKISHIQMPVLFIHGLADATVPASMSQQLYKDAPEPKQLWLLPEASHNNITAIAGVTYQGTLQQWLLTPD